jgi:hypothetical protein
MGHHARFLVYDDERAVLEHDVEGDVLGLDRQNLRRGYVDFDALAGLQPLRFPSDLPVHQHPTILDQGLHTNSRKVGVSGDVRVETVTTPRDKEDFDSTL